MPFTVSHSIAAFLLIKPLKSQAVISALIIGCMVPDLIYYLPGMPVQLDTHNFAALFWFSLPAGILVYSLYHRLISPTLLVLLPTSITLRLNLLSTAGRLPDVKWHAVAISVFLGASTHVFWDSFTHQSSLSTHTLPVLNAVILTIGSYDLRFYNFLQHLSSWIGLLALCYVAVKRYKSTAANSTISLKIDPAIRWGARTALLLLPALAGIYFIADNARFLMFEHAVIRAIFQSGALFLAIWMCLGLFLSRHLKSILIHLDKSRS